MSSSNDISMASIEDDASDFGSIKRIGDDSEYDGQSMAGVSDGNSI